MTAVTPRRRRPPNLVVVPLVLVVLAIGVAAVMLDPARTPHPTAGPTAAPAAFPPPTAPLIVNLNRAKTGPAHVGYAERITASALGRSGVAGLELWAGGKRLELTTTGDSARPAASARWDWVPERDGDVVLVARAFDAAGQTTQSSPLRISVTVEPPRSFQLAELAATAGETLEAVVTRAGGDLAAARYFNNELPAGPLPAGTTVLVPTDDPIVPPTATRDHDLSDAAPVAELGPILAVGLVTPQLTATVTDCTVTASASNGGTATEGFAFSALPPTGDTFLALPPLAPSADGSATTTFFALAGTNYLTVASYDAEATAPSAIVPVVVPSECAEGWQGDARLDAGKLVVNGSADRAYLYLRIGTGAWQRVPAGSAFVEPVDGTFDFGPLLPPTADSDLRLEAWGWAGGSLVKLGAGSYTAPKQTFYSGGLQLMPDPLLGFGTSLDYVSVNASNEFPEQLTKHTTIDRPDLSSAPLNRTFKWSTTVPGVTHLVWQVLPYPLGTTSTTLTPPFLIDSDTIAVQGLTSGYFTLDLKPYLVGASAASWSTTLLTDQLVGEISQANLFGPSPTAAAANVLVDPGGIYLPKATSGTGGTAGPASISEAMLQDLGSLAPALTALYVRVIPFVGTQPVPNASNPVTFDIVEPGEPFFLDLTPSSPPPTYLDAYTMVASFIAPTGSSKAYYHCVIVVESLLQPGDWYYPLFQPGTTHCEPTNDDGWSLSDAFEAFVGWVGEAWDLVSDAYQWAKEQVVNAVLLIVPCQTIAQEVAKQGEEDSEAVCRTIAKTALDAALATFGIPPEIPDWKSTLSAVKGDLRTFILENAKDEFPAVASACDVAATANAAENDFPTCEELVDEAIDIAIKEIAESRSEAAAKQAGVYVPAGVLVEPHPKSMPQPPHFDITVSRTNAPLPDGTACQISGRMTSTVENWQWSEAPVGWSGGNNDLVDQTGSVTGEPFMDAKQPIAALAPGESATFQLWLSKAITWFEPDGFHDEKAQEYYQWYGQYNRAWVLLQEGATVVGKLSSNCLHGGESVQILSGQAFD
jgi:hypothetical protein